MFHNCRPISAGGGQRQCCMVDVDDVCVLCVMFHGFESDEKEEPANDGRALAMVGQCL